MLFKSFSYLDQSKINPPKHTVREESDVYFECLSYDPAIWSFIDGHLLPNAQPRGSNSLFIERVKLGNRGYYECQGTDDEQSTFYARCHLKILSNKIISEIQQLWVYYTYASHI